MVDFAGMSLKFEYTEENVPSVPSEGVTEEDVPSIQSEAVSQEKAPSVQCKAETEEVLSVQSEAVIEHIVPSISAEAVTQESKDGGELECHENTKDDSDMDSQGTSTKNLIHWKNVAGRMHVAGAPTESNEFDFVWFPFMAKNEPSSMRESMIDVPRIVIVMDMVSKELRLLAWKLERLIQRKGYGVILKMIMLHDIENHPRKNGTTSRSSPHMKPSRSKALQMSCDKLAHHPGKLIIVKAGEEAFPEQEVELIQLLLKTHTVDIVNITGQNKVQLNEKTSQLLHQAGGVNWSMKDTNPSVVLGTLCGLYVSLGFDATVSVSVQPPHTILNIQGPGITHLKLEGSVANFNIRSVMECYSSYAISFGRKAEDGSFRERRSEPPLTVSTVVYYRHVSGRQVWEEEEYTFPDPRYPSGPVPKVFDNLRLEHNVTTTAASTRVSRKKTSKKCCCIIMLAVSGVLLALMGAYLYSLDTLCLVC